MALRARHGTGTVPVLRRSVLAVSGLPGRINVASATGLNILTGYTGQVSLGQAAFMGVGAYAVAILEKQLGTPVLLNLLAGGAAMLVGLVVGIPSLRVKGLYLAIATRPPSSCISSSPTGPASPAARRALTVPPATTLRPGAGYRVPPLLADHAAHPVLMLAGAANLFRTRIGRAFIAIRDRDISAEVLGIPLLRYKLLSFGLSSFYAGVAGGLWAYFFRVVTPESFPLSMSIFFLAAIIVGGMGASRRPSWARCS